MSDNPFSAVRACRTLPPLSFTVVGGNEMTPALWREVADLFSVEYGLYSANAPSHAGRQIRLGVTYYERSYASRDYQVALCRDGVKLVAQAIYRECMTDRGRLAFVVQLVVAEAYRRKGIASTLLHAIWGFSDYYAWGIVTSNAFTVEALEAATFRRADSSVIAKNERWLRENLLNEVPFLASARWHVGVHESRIESNFYTDRSHAGENTQAVSVRLGTLDEGEEWLALVFREQRLDNFAAYQSVIDSSSAFVAEAYRQMPQENQPWAKEAASEVEELLRMIPELPHDARIADFGAGSGRHLRELRSRGFLNLVGVDFSGKHDADPAVIRDDCRTWISPSPCDLILCLYDVIGSFRCDADNKAILRNIARNLKPNGYAAISVSNFNYLDRTKLVEVDLSDPKVAVEKVFDLRPSTTMWHDGEFFDPAYVLVDVKRHLVCHKEQFPASASSLPGEYLIQDRRFTMHEIVRWAEDAGLHVELRRFVCAGFKADRDEAEGKEILLVTRKEVSS